MLLQIPSAKNTLQLQLPFIILCFFMVDYSVIYFKKQPSSQHSGPGNGLGQEQYHLLQSRTSVYLFSYDSSPRTSNQPLPATPPGHGHTKHKLHSCITEGLNYSLREWVTSCVHLKFDHRSYGTFVGTKQFRQVFISNLIQLLQTDTLLFNRAGNSSNAQALESPSWLAWLYALTL